MTQKGYKQYVIGQICNYPYNTPIYTEEIANQLAANFHLNLNNAKAVVNVIMPRIAENGQLLRYAKGVYYRAENTVFGKTKLNPALINRDRYLIKDGEIVGYETGAAFLNQIGLTTQIPKYKKFATNQFKHRGSRTDKKLQVIIRKPKTRVTRENYQYLQVLDAIENKDRIAIEVPNPEKVYLAHIVQNKLETHKLFDLAKQFYTSKTRQIVFDIYAIGIS